MIILKRILAFPFVFGLLIIGTIWTLCERCYLYFAYGGEFAHYERNDKILIRDIYEQLKELRNEE